MKKTIKDEFDEIETQIAFLKASYKEKYQKKHTAKGKLNQDYEAGYIDGMKQALNLLKQ